MSEYTVEVIFEPTGDYEDFKAMSCRSVPSQPTHLHSSKAYYVYNQRISSTSE